MKNLLLIAALSMVLVGCNLNPEPASTNNSSPIPATNAVVVAVADATVVISVTGGAEHVASLAQVDINSDGALTLNPPIAYRQWIYEGHINSPQTHDLSGVIGLFAKMDQKPSEKPGCALKSSWKPTIKIEAATCSDKQLLVSKIKVIWLDNGVVTSDYLQGPPQPFKSGWVNAEYFN